MNETPTNEQPPNLDRHLPSIERGSLVIAYLSSPKERVWGILLRLDTNGIIIRGLDLNSLEDWFAQERSGTERLITPSTQFVPIHRLERVYADERSGNVESYGERFAATCDRDVREALLGEPPE